MLARRVVQPPRCLQLLSQLCWLRPQPRLWPRHVRLPWRRLLGRPRPQSHPLQPAAGCSAPTARRTQRPAGASTRQRARRCATRAACSSRARARTGPSTRRSSSGQHPLLVRVRAWRRGKLQAPLRMASHSRGAACLMRWQRWLLLQRSRLQRCQGLRHHRPLPLLWVAWLRSRRLLSLSRLHQWVPNGRAGATQPLGHRSQACCTVLSRAAAALSGAAQREMRQRSSEPPSCRACLAAQSNRWYLRLAGGA
mmetsp:Transcript_3640/g.9106  ORF Transcript_3640/g.9106 Transcript_3640/m.9106 type:complete len:252 (-) Transcript_3640:310-1065(-)